MKLVQVRLLRGLLAPRLQQLGARLLEFRLHQALPGLEVGASAPLLVRTQGFERRFSLLLFGLQPGLQPLGRFGGLVGSFGSRFVHVGLGQAVGSHGREPGIVGAEDEVDEARARNGSHRHPGPEGRHRRRHGNAGAEILGGAAEEFRPDELDGRAHGTRSQLRRTREVIALHHLGDERLPHQHPVLRLDPLRGHGLGHIRAGGEVGAGLSNLNLGHRLVSRPRGVVVGGGEHHGHDHAGHDEPAAVPQRMREPDPLRGRLRGRLSLGAEGARVVGRRHRPQEAARRAQALLPSSRARIPGPVRRTSRRRSKCRRASADRSAPP